MNFSALDDFLANLDKRGKSATDCAIYLDGKLVHRHMRGLIDREHNIPVGEDTLYRMFSMTKPITCVAMMQLYEQGKFLLSDPVSVYLPEFEHMIVAHRQPTEAASITLHQLFTMTSGLSYNLETDPLRALYASNPDYSTRDFVKAIAKSPLLFQPGEHWYYSLAHDVLAAVVEVISGMRFSEYLKKNIFEPLGMKDWYFHVPQDQIHRSCVRYCYDAKEQRYYRDINETDTMRYNMYQRGPNFESGGAGLTTTVNEYAKFANMLTRLGTAEDGTRIIGESTLNMMRENHLNPQQEHDFNWIQFHGYSYGLGMRTLVSRAQAGSAGALGEYGWGGAAGTYFLSDPANHLTVVYAQQATPNDEVYVHPRLRNLIYAGLEY